MATVGQVATSGSYLTHGPATVSSPHRSAARWPP